MNIAALDRRLRALAERFLSLAGRRIGRIAVAFLVLGVLLIVLNILAPVHGLEGRYFSNPDRAGPPVATALDRNISFPKAFLSARADDAERLSVVWKGFIFCPKSSVYRFVVRSDDGARIFVDGALVVDNGGVHPAQERERVIPLARGSRRLRIEYFDAGDDGVIDFRWRETKTPKALMPRLPLYPRPVRMGLFIWDTVQANLRPLLRALFAVAGLLLLLAAARAAIHRGEILQVIALAAFVVLAGLYELEVFTKKSTSVSGCDTYAYLQGAELMSRNGIFRTEITDPLAARTGRAYASRPEAAKTIFLLAPHGYYVYDLDQGRAYNLFPPGMSLILSPLVKIFGRTAAFWVLPLLNAALLVLVFLIAARAAGAVFGLVLAAVTFFNFHVFENSVIIMSDLPSMGLLLLAAFLVHRNGLSAKPIRSLLAGACFGPSRLLGFFRFLRPP